MRAIAPGRHSLPDIPPASGSGNFLPGRRGRGKPAVTGSSLLTFQSAFFVQGGVACVCNLTHTSPSLDLWVSWGKKKKGGDTLMLVMLTWFSFFFSLRWLSDNERNPCLDPRLSSVCGPCALFPHCWIFRKQLFPVLVFARMHHHGAGLLECLA